MAPAWASAKPATAACLLTILTFAAAISAGEEFCSYYDDPFRPTTIVASG
jgi:hypothetical protein